MPRLADLRRHARLIASAVLVLVIGALGLAASRSAGQRAIEVHRSDRLQLEQLLSSITAQSAYGDATSLQRLLAGNRLGGAASFSARPEVATQAADVARLRAVLREVPAFDAGGAVLNGLGEVVVEWSPTGALPARTDPGLAPLIGALTAGGAALPLSGVLDVAGEPVIATGAPVVLADRSTGLFVALWHPRTSAMQGYNERLSAEYGVDGWIVDARGRAVLAPREALVGKVLPEDELRQRLPDTGSGILDTREGDRELVTAYAEVTGTSWTGLAVQERSAFQGALESDSRRSQVALVLLLLLTGGGMAGMHRRREAELHSAAHSDELTGVLNRRGWFEAAEQELARCRRSDDSLALLFVDLDGLKQVNDVLGHLAGDRAIVAAASVLRAAAHKGELIGRLGGDEFVLLAAAGIESVEARVAAALAAFNATSDAPFDLRFSFGSQAWSAAEPCTLEELVRRADAVMYVDKSSRPSRSSAVVRLPEQVGGARDRAG